MTEKKYTWTVAESKLRIYRANQKVAEFDRSQFLRIIADMVRALL